MFHLKSQSLHLYFGKLQSGLRADIIDIADIVDIDIVDIADIEGWYWQYWYEKLWADTDTNTKILNYGNIFIF